MILKKKSDTDLVLPKIIGSGIRYPSGTAQDISREIKMSTDDNRRLQTPSDTDTDIKQIGTLPKGWQLSTLLVG